MRDYIEEAIINNPVLNYLYKKIQDLDNAGGGGINLGVTKDYVDAQDQDLQDQIVALRAEIEAIDTSIFATKGELDADYIDSDVYPDPEFQDIKEVQVRILKEKLSLSLDKIDRDIKKAQSDILAIDVGSGGGVSQLYVDTKDAELKIKINQNTTNIDLIAQAPLTADADILGTEEILGRNADGTIITINQSVLAGSSVDSTQENVLILDSEVGIDLASIDPSYNALHINTLPTTVGEIIISNMSSSNIRKVTISASEVYTVSGDVAIDSTGVSNFITSSRLIRKILFGELEGVYMSEVFSCNIPRYGSVIIGQFEFYLPWIDERKSLFSIEFSQDLKRVVSYYNLDEFLIPCTYTASTNEVLPYGHTVFFWFGNNENNKVFIDESMIQIHKDGNYDDVTYLIDFPSVPILDSEHHVVILHVPYAFKSEWIPNNGGFFTKAVHDASGGVIGVGANPVITISNTIRSPYPYITCLNDAGHISKNKLKMYRDSNEVNSRVVNDGSVEPDEFYTTSCRMVNGLPYVATASNTADIGFTSKTTVLSNKAGCAVSSLWEHALSSVTYFEKGEFDFPTSFEDLQKK